ncbi:MAG: adenosylcobinamide-GDP ribazoletransferase [Planktomarina sp.]
MTQMNPTWRPQASDIAYAAGLLTRIRLPVDGEAAMTRGAAAAWAFPVVGIILGVGFYAVYSTLAAIDLPPMICATLAVAAACFATGAMHEDGFADVLDGFWGGWDRARRLEIMKDSHIGVYGVLGLIIVIGLKVQLYAAIMQSTPWAILGIFALSRAVMVGVMVWVPNARGAGLSHSVGVPSSNTAWIALGLGGLTVLIFGSVLSGIAVLASAVCMVAIAKAKIGGQTGDVLGATQNISEIAGLIVLAAVL